MAQKFNMELRTQQEWGWLLALWLFLSGSGSSLFLLFEIFDLPLPLAVASLAIVFFGGAVLLYELGSPLRAWRGFTRASTSWLSRGVISVSSFILFSALAIAPGFEAFSGLPWTRASAAGTVLNWVAGFAALMITLYPGFFLAKNRSIPFWNTPLLPLVFFTLSILGGCGVALAASPFLNVPPVDVAPLAAIGIVVEFALLAVFLAAKYRSGGPARESVRILSRGPLGALFWVGAVGLGMILPLGGIVSSDTAFLPVGVAILAGGILIRYCILKAGVFVPFALVSGGLDLSRLNRTPGNLEREYAAAALSKRRAGGGG